MTYHDRLCPDQIRLRSTPSRIDLLIKKVRSLSGFQTELNFERLRKGTDGHPTSNFVYFCPKINIPESLGVKSEMSNKTVTRLRS